MISVITAAGKEEGYNDRVGVQLWKYETQSIDLPTLVRNLQHMKGITFQYFFGTEAAIKLLKRL